MMKTPKQKCEAGNAFILVLLGVVLFATLSITVSRSMRSETTSNLSEREITLAATEILSAASRTEGAVNRVRRRGCSENEISFENEIVTGYANAGAPGDLSCHVFSPGAGSVSWPQIDEKWLDKRQSAQLYYQQSMFPSHSEVDGIGDNDVHELLYMVLWLDEAVCMKINEMLGITAAKTAPPVDTGNMWSSLSAGTLKYTGTFVGAGAYNISGAGVSGQNSACVEGDGDPPADTFHFFHVLIAR